MNAVLIDHLKKYVISNLDLSIEYSDEKIQAIIRQCLSEHPETSSMENSKLEELAKGVFYSLRRLDVLQPFLEDPFITEIMVNGPDMIFIEVNGKIKRIEDTFVNQERLLEVIQSIVSKVNRTVNESHPIVDARLEDGSRICVVLPPVSLQGPLLTIRKFPATALTLDTMIREGTLTKQAATFVSHLVRSKYNIFISGGTGSGKTTFLNALSDCIPMDERIVTIEDSAELQIRSVENIVRLEKRNPNTEGAGEISIRELIKTSLRMRPDRIIVGEVRGEEALDMLSAMNTGHDGSLSTGHANSPKDMLHRLETMVLSSTSIPLPAIRQQIASAIDILIHLAKLRDSTRHVVEIVEVIGVKDEEYSLNPLFVFEEELSNTCKSKVSGVLQRTQNTMLQIEKFVMSGMTKEDMEGLL